MKKIHFLLNLLNYQYQNGNINIYLRYSKVFFSEFFVTLLFYYKLIILEKYEKIFFKFK